MSVKQKNRARVAPKMGGLDVDYRTLYNAFFVHQTKPTNLTKMGDLYYEGKEFEVRPKYQPGAPLSDKLRQALGMVLETSPPPWLINMQRYGPPPSYPHLKIPGLNAPLPLGATYGYHVGGWGKPPVDPYNRPLYGGNPFDTPGRDADGAATGTLVTSDGKALSSQAWGALPMAEQLEEEEEEEEQDDDSVDMEESEEEEEEGEVEVVVTQKPVAKSQQDLVPPPPQGGVDSVVPKSAGDLRKQGGDETPAPKALYTVLEATKADSDKQASAVFASDVAYVMPPEGAESVLSKVGVGDLGREETMKRKRGDDDGASDLDKKFKF